MAKNKIIKVQDIPITVASEDMEDYICITDMAAAKGGDSRAADVVKNWLRNRLTLEFLDLFKSIDINEGLRKMQSTEGAVLVDVRTREEYAGGHIPGSMNILLDELQTALDRISDSSTPLFVHCLSGGRSRQAVSILRQFGYSDVTDIGGIQNYRGKTEKGA